jgi:tyrosyl-tRNA synthetase
MVSENMPTTTLSADQFADGKISVIDMLVVSKLAPSKGEARRLIQQGGVALGESKIEAFDATVSLEAFEGDVVIRKGKKVFHRFVLA